MAFFKYAKAKLQKPDIKFAEWSAISNLAIMPSPDFQKRTARVILDEYNPKQYMLSHATIVASVDVDQAPGVLGKSYVDGFEIDRKYNDYYVTPKTSHLINNNHDCFERKLLLATFKTFIGAQSYVEHVQLPELSKGRIIDAAARDIGDSVYIDILIASELRHAPLIRAIKSGQLGNLSMGCSTSETSCTRCGNVAKDETQLCNHIKFFKGSKFKDESGISRVVAELCGHHTDPSSVRFIEASWVANPAFKGAVIRNILSAEEVGAVEKKLHMAFSMPPPMQDLSMQKAARYHYGQQQVEEAPAAEPADSAQQAAPEPKEDKDPISKAVEDLSNALRNQAIEHVRNEINKGEAKQVEEVVDENKQNESLIKSALLRPEWRKIAQFVVSFVGKPQAKKVMYGLLLHKSGGWTKVKKAGLSGTEVLAVSRVLDVMTKKSAMAGETRVYRTVLSVGGTAPYENDETYLAACRQVLGRVITGNEAYRLLEKGRLYSLGR